MSDEKPSLHVDTDWKKQAQEEKRKLAEKAAKEEQTFKPAAMASTPIGGAMDPVSAAAPTALGGRGKGAQQRELPDASIATLASSILTQTMYYLGQLAYSGGDPVTNLDMAKHNIDTLQVLEEKTANNLTDDERHALDLALHEARSRYVNIASQFI